MNPNFIFIGGIPRSGTSLIQKIVGLNEDVYAGPEFDHLPSIVKLYFQMLGNERQAEFYTDNGLTNSFRKFIESVLAEKLFEKQIKVKYISEKTPENILAFKGLEKIFPNAKFLIIIRDPRAVINSFQNVSLRAKRSGTSVKFGKNIIKDLSFMRYRIDLAEQISNENPDKCFILHYEDLLKDPESVISSICTFLDLKYTK
ncbi:MAG: sulfotransferase, partial [Ekhidna sp.]